MMKQAQADSSDWRRFTTTIAWPTVGLFAFLLIGHIATWHLVLTDAIPLVVGTILQVIFAYLAFTPLHEAVHGNVFGTVSGRADGIVGWFSAALLFAAYPAFRVLHLTHHSHTNEPARDPDHWVAGRGALAIVARCWSIFPRYMIDFFFGKTSQTKAARDARSISAIYFGLQGILLLALTISGLGLEAILLWVVPALLASGLLALAFDWLPHHPHQEIGRYVDTRVVLFPGLGYLTLGQSYHSIHHLYPRIPFYWYGKAFRSMRGLLEANGTRVREFSRSAGRPQ